MQLDWQVVKNVLDQEIGAIGFAGDTAVVVVAFYDDKDADNDGKVSWKERAVSAISPVPLKGRQIAEVAMQGRIDAGMRDPSFGSLAGRLLVDFGFNAIMAGVYKVYFSRAVGDVAKQIAGRATEKVVAQFVIRKGMEHLVKSAYDRSLK